MPIPTTSDGITGTDNIQPIYRPFDGWKMWDKAEIYIGQQGENRFVPKIGDFLKDKETGYEYRVIDLDPTTLIPTWVRVKPPLNDGTLTTDDILLGTGPGPASNTFRIYIDKSKTPHTLSVDRRLRIPGMDATKAKIYRGTDLTSNPRVISAFYDQSGNLLGQEIPLAMAEISNQNGQNVSVKYVPTCYTTEDLPDNEIVTVSLYSDLGILLFRQALVVENTAFLASSNLAVKYVTGIELKTPFMSSTDATLIQYPINVPTQGMNLMGVVHYSDGSELSLPVDGTKFNIFGLDAYTATVVGQEADVILTYNLSADEIVYGASVGDGRHISVSLRAKTMEVDGSYSPKLFGYPVWIDALNGYRLEWFLANLERTAIFKATPFVSINENTMPFNSLLWGSVQRLSVRVNLKDVNPTLGDYIHTQTLDVVLLEPGTTRLNGNWTVGFDPGQNPPFGRNHASATFINANNWRVKIDQDEPVFDAWLERLYYRTRPLYDTYSEDKAPAPTHFAFVFNDATFEFPISEWKLEHTVGHSLTNSGTLFVKFFKRTADNDIELAMIGMPIWQTP